MFDAQRSKRPEQDRSQADPAQETSRTKQSTRHTGDPTRIPAYTQLAWGNQPPPWLRLPVQWKEPHEVELLQEREGPLTQRKENTTGLPDTLKAAVENLSAMSMDDVNVHYNSSKPAEIEALAYTQDTEIHVGPGQEQHLAHEAWHVVQQKQGRVQPTVQTREMAINDDLGLEREADAMGVRALMEVSPQPLRGQIPQHIMRNRTVQMGRKKEKKEIGRQSKKVKYAIDREEAEKDLSTDPDFELLKPEEKETAINLAIDREQGIDIAHGFIGNTLMLKRSKANKDNRQKKVNDVITDLTPHFDGLTLTILNAAASGYVSLDPNVTAAGDQSMVDILQSVGEWTTITNHTDDITNAHAYTPVNKAAQGKGQVGNTLAKRSWQANFISLWFGRTINVHVDLRKKDIPKD